MIRRVRIGDRVSLTFVVGAAADVFGVDLAQPKAFADAPAKLPAAEAATATAVDVWLALEVMREEIEG